MPATAIINPIANATVPAGKSLFVPVTASDTAGYPLSYAVASSDPKVTAQVLPGNTYMDVTVAGYGDMLFQLFNDLTPQTAATIGGLVQSGFYNGLTFHRVAKNFVIQGGDPQGNGNGGPGFSFNDEYNPDAIFSGSGQLALAKPSSQPSDSNGSQFFVTTGPPSVMRLLDFDYTIFGQLVRGFDVLNKINAVPTNNETPLTPIVMTRVALVQDPYDAVLLVKAQPGASPATITVAVNDGHGGTSTQRFQAQTVSDSSLNPPIDDPPILGPVPDGLTTPQNTPITIPLTATDLEGDPLAYAAVESDGKTNASVAVSGNQVTVTPNAGYTGPIQLVVGVRQDPATNRGVITNPYDTQVITIGVGDQSLSATPNGLVTRPNTPLNNALVAVFTDADPSAQVGQFTASINWGAMNPSSPARAASITTGTVVKVGGQFAVLGSNTYARPGSYVAQVTITDSGGASAKVSVPVQVQPFAPGDYNNAGKTDVAVFRVPTAQWFALPPGASPVIQQFGGPGDVPVPADYDGDGKTDIALYRPSNGTWYVIQSSGGVKVVSFGAPNLDIPVPGDYDGDGKTDIAVFRPTTDQWFILKSSGGVQIQQFGGPGDIPVPADYDGDGKTDIAVYRPSNGTWYIIQSLFGVSVRPFGAPNLDLPMPADFDGDGRADLAVLRPSTYQWFVAESSGGILAQQFGGPGDIPVPADYEGNGKADVAVYRPSNGTWYILRSGGGAQVTPFGAPGLDVPLVTPLVFRYNGSLTRRPAADSRTADLLRTPVDVPVAIVPPQAPTLGAGDGANSGPLHRSASRGSSPTAEIVARALEQLAGGS